MPGIIHVNQHNIKRNTQYLNRAQEKRERQKMRGADPGPVDPEKLLPHLDPVITCKSGSGSNEYGYTAKIVDRKGHVVARIVYRPFDPLSCGARVWIETDCEIQVEQTMGD